MKSFFNFAVLGSRGVGGFAKDPPIGGDVGCEKELVSLDKTDPMPPGLKIFDAV